MAILDTIFQINLGIELKKWMSDKENYVPSTVHMKYLHGKLLAAYGKDWKDVRHVYIPFNLNKKHWVALEIDLEKWLVTVYDCDIYLYKISDLHLYLNDLTSLLPILIFHHGSLESLHDRRGGGIH